MQIFLNILYLVGGIIFLIKGADLFVSGASAVAKKFKVPSLIIGLTVVAIGTSLPELAVSVSSAISGSVELSVGNVIGSNLSNMLLIIGIIALFSPIIVKKSSKQFDFPFLIIVTGLLLVSCVDTILNGAKVNIITRTECIIFVFLFFYYIIRNVKNAKNNKLDFEEQPNNQEKDENAKELKIWQIILFIVIGLAGVVGGGELVSNSAKFLAIKAGMSEALVGLTIVAVGTSLPELATSVVAARKGETDLAIGNVIGSNILNIVLILGVVGLIKQIEVSTLILTDLLILFGATLIFTFLSLRKQKLSKLEGVILLLIYIGYISFAIVRNYCF